MTVQCDEDEDSGGNDYNDDDAIVIVATMKEIGIFLDIFQLASAAEIRYAYYMRLHERMNYVLSKYVHGWCGNIIEL